MRKYKKIIKQILFFIFIILFIYFLSTVEPETLEEISSRLGWLGPLFIGLFVMATQVFAPLSGSAMFFAGIRIYGYEQMIVLFYVASMISASICFFIARKWGRGLVERLVGKDTMGQVDDIASLHEKPLLIIGRTLGYYFFDFISYALGLTKISFKKYITYTLSLTLIPSFLLYFVFKDLDFNSFKSSMIFYFFVAVTGMISIYLFRRIVKKASKKENNL